MTVSSTVPVYDARNIDLKLGGSLYSLAEDMPVFDGEIPKGSLVTVLYSANTYRKKYPGGQGLGEKQLSLNIQSVIVLGTTR